MAVFARPTYLGQWRTAEDPAGYSRLGIGNLLRQMIAASCIDIDQQAGKSALKLAACCRHRTDGRSGPRPKQTHVVFRSGLLQGLLGYSSGWDANDESCVRGPHDESMRNNVRILEEESRASVAALETFLNGDELILEGYERLEGYYTAASDGGEAPEPVEAAAAAPAQDLLAQLLNHSAEQGRVLTGLQARLASLDSVNERLRLLEAAPRDLPAVVAAGGKAPLAEDLPAWAPRLFADGARGSLAPGQVQRLMTLAGRGPTHLGDLPGPEAAGSSSMQLGARTKAKATPPLASLTVPEDAEEVDDEPEAAEVGGKLLGQLLSQQTKILAQLAASARKTTDPMHLLGARRCQTSRCAGDGSSATFEGPLSRRIRWPSTAVSRSAWPRCGGDHPSRRWSRGIYSFTSRTPCPSATTRR